MANTVSMLKRRRSSQSCSAGLAADLAVAGDSAHIVVHIAAAEVATFPATPTPTVMGRVADLIVNVS